MVIGRNEGQRLIRCLKSVTRRGVTVVYVDSGSTDSSVAVARDLNVDVVELDMSTPFCAARARNEGYARLVTNSPQVRFVQFVDGDCELADDWLSVAHAEIKKNPDTAIVSGWLHERQPEVSVYNRLGEVEWNFSGIGEVESVGGIFMIRREAFDSVSGFDPTVASGEEPELCQRLRRKAWRLFRIDHDMAWHDLAMTRFGQWWRRMVRFGYGTVDVAERFNIPRFRRNVLRARAWTAWLLVFLMLSAFFFRGGLGSVVTMLWLGLWPAQIGRIAWRSWRSGLAPSLSVIYGFFIMLSLWPQMLGQFLWWADRRRKRTFRLVEYKSTDHATSAQERVV